MHYDFKTELESLTDKLDAIIRQIDRMEQRMREISPENKDLLTVEECASLLDLKRSTVYRMTSESRIPHFKKGGRVYFSKEEILNWLKDSQNSERREG